MKGQVGFQCTQLDVLNGACSGAIGDGLSLWWNEETVVLIVIIKNKRVIVLIQEVRVMDLDELKAKQRRILS